MRAERKEKFDRRQLANALSFISGDSAQFVRHDTTPWASATFAGTRHAVTLVFAGTEAVEAGERLVAALPEHEFTLPGQVVIDATVTAVEHALLPEPQLTVEAELLLLEES